MLLGEAAPQPDPFAATWPLKESAAAIHATAQAQAPYWCTPCCSTRLRSVLGRTWWPTWNSNLLLLLSACKFIQVTEVCRAALALTRPAGAADVQSRCIAHAA